MVALECNERDWFIVSKVSKARHVEGRTQLTFILGLLPHLFQIPEQEDMVSPVLHSLALSSLVVLLWWTRVQIAAAGLDLLETSSWHEGENPSINFELHFIVLD